MTGNVVNPSSERVLIDNVPSTAPGVHNGGDLQFGPDGHLYVSVGTAAATTVSRAAATTTMTQPRTATFSSGKCCGSHPRAAFQLTIPLPRASSARCAAAGRTERGYTCREIYASARAALASRVRSPRRTPSDDSSPRATRGHTHRYTARWHWHRVGLLASSGQFVPPVNSNERLVAGAASQTLSISSGLVAPPAMRGCPRP